MARHIGPKEAAAIATRVAQTTAAQLHPLDVHTTAIRAAIKRIEGGFVEVAERLAAIKDGSLFKRDFRTFGEYLDSIGISRSYATRQMNGATIVSQIMAASPKMVPIGNKTTPPSPTLPTNESQTRALSEALPEDRSEVWSDAVSESGDKPPTAKKVREVVARKAHKPTSQPDPSTSVGSNPKPFGVHLPHCATCRCGYS